MATSESPLPVINKEFVAGLKKGLSLPETRQVAHVLAELNRLREARAKAMRAKKLAKERWDKDDFTGAEERKTGGFKLKKLEDQCRNLLQQINGTEAELEKEIAEVLGGTLFSIPPEDDDSEESDEDAPGQMRLAGATA